MDITYRTEYGILEIEPTGSLEEQDFESLDKEIKHIRETGQELKGILIYTKDFPGYSKFSDLIAHGEFIKTHRDQIRKVALCTDSTAGMLLEVLGENLTAAETKKFAYADKDEAEKWLLS